MGIILDAYAENKIATVCICCGETIPLGHNYSALVPRMCDRCKDVIRWVNEIKKLCADWERAE